ncbi:MAG: hypothetical protein KKE17_01820 [Proteobacteria bacterium]|nr:hypothetical protein [Pseudomonadota bacterium]MBU1708720.1 hypothetical protein [Pseudomonadota bacterium]
MNKTIVILIAAATFGLAGYQFADAGSRNHGGGMDGECDMELCCEQGPGACLASMSEEDKAAHLKFKEDTKDLRKKMAMKKAELKAVMASETPNQGEAGKLAGELFELRDELKTKALAAGIKPGMGKCDKAGMGKCDKGPGQKDGEGHHGKGADKHCNK